MMSSKSTPGQRSVIVTDGAILIFKYTSSAPYFSSFPFPVRWMKMKRRRLSPLLSQRASEYRPFDAARYRQSPSAEVTPKVTSQKDDEKINLSQWEKNRSACVRVQSLRLKWCRYTDICDEFRVEWHTAESQDTQEWTELYGNLTDAVATETRVEGLKCTQHTQHSRAHNRTRSLLFLPTFSRELVLLNKKRVLKRKTKITWNGGVRFWCRWSTFIAQVIVDSLPVALKQRVMCRVGRNMKDLVEGSLRLIPPWS